MSNENVHPVFKEILDSISGAQSADSIPTTEGNKTIPEIMDRLMRGSYSANRGYGCTHEQLVRHGIGNDAMRERYDRYLDSPKVVLGVVPQETIDLIKSIYNS